MVTPDMCSNPYPHYARMRANAPIFFNPARQVWEVYGYKDIQTVLSDPVIFSSNVYGAAGQPKMQTMLTMDPPRHAQFRKLITHAFTTKVVTALEPRIQKISHELLNQVASTGQMDIMRDFAFPLPVTVIAELLDVPVTDRDQLKRWSEYAVMMAEATIKGEKPAPHLLEAVAEFMQYIETLAIERKRKPGDDLISRLATASVDGEQLTTQEIGGTCRLLLIAGYETTTNLIGNAMHLLLEHSDALAQLRATPELLSSAIEEVLRHRTAVQFVGRIATRDVSLGGQLIRAGQKIIAFNGSGVKPPKSVPL
ncbi:MAG: cytochrome P450 [Burkholderiaceae bacterium]|nr:MAG: cytochrome P450 [Burkholderiaceae bacterium]